MLRLVCVCVVLAASGGVASGGMTATCDIKATSGSPTVNVQGTVTLSQAMAGGPTSLTISLSGFNAAAYGQKRGFHVHAKGLLTRECKDAAGHFNPRNVSHGAPADASTVRHFGDLGNVNVSSAGAVQTTITDRLVSLYPPDSVIGLAIVVHNGTDDLGLGGATDSKTTGHAGGRIGCCVITSTTSGASMRAISMFVIMTTTLFSVVLSCLHHP